VTALRAFLADLRLWLAIDKACVGCGVALTTTERREVGVCSGCAIAVAEQTLIPFRADFMRLRAKRRGYAKAGAKTAATDAQLIRLIGRMQMTIDTLPRGIRNAAPQIVEDWVRATA
jgi:hypothetical protein